MNHQCAVGEEDLGPYLLGQLDPQAQAATGRLVDACPTCAAEVARLRPVVAAMAEATPAGTLNDLLAGTPAPVTAAPAALDQLLATIGARRQGRRAKRRVVAVGLAAVLVTLAAALSVRFPHGSDAQATLAGRGPSPRSVGEVRLDEQPWGTAIRLEARGLQAGQTYGVWLERRGGTRLTAGSFVPDSGGTVDLRLSSGISLQDSRAVGVALLPGGRMADAVDVMSASLS